MNKYKKIKDLREDHDYTQEFVANYLQVKRSTYANWENGDVSIPLKIVDKLSLLYNVPLSFLLGISSKKENEKINPMIYDNVLSNLNKLKENNRYSYQKIAEALGVSRSQCYKYYKGICTIPTHIMISLYDFYKVDIDRLCGKIS